MKQLPSKTRIWDLPTRLFHWALVVCVVGALVTVKLGGNWMQWHLNFGIATLALLVFRVLWGLGVSAPSLDSRYASGRT